jgi:hypothetical protein
MPVQVQRLQDDRRARRVLGGDAIDADRAREAARAPGDVARVRARRQLGAVLDEPERRAADRRVADELLDVARGQDAVEAAGLVTGDDERPALPVLGEEDVRRDGLEREPERAGRLRRDWEGGGRRGG